MNSNQLLIFRFNLSTRVNAQFFKSTQPFLNLAFTRSILCAFKCKPNAVLIFNSNEMLRKVEQAEIQLVADANSRSYVFRVTHSKGIRQTEISTNAAKFLAHELHLWS